MVRCIGVICAVLLLSLSIVSCGAKKVDVKPEVKKPKKERPLFQMMMHRPQDDRIFFEDDWFTYELELERVVKGRNSMPVNSLGGECRYQGATYTVVDKETESIIRVIKLGSQPCNNCHKR